MRIVLAVLMFVLSIVLTIEARRAGASRTPPWWAGQNFVGNVVCPLIVSFVAFGSALLIQAFAQMLTEGLTAFDVVTLAAALVAVPVAGRFYARRRPMHTAEIVPFPDAVTPVEPHGPTHRNAA